MQWWNEETHECWGWEKFEVRAPLWEWILCIRDYPRLRSTNLIITVVSKVWRKLQNVLVLGIFPLSSITWHPEFCTAALIANFSKWKEKGLTQFCSLGNNPHMTMQDHTGNILEKSGNISHQFKYQYKQVNNLMKCLQKRSDIFRPLTEFESLIKDLKRQKLFKLYTLLLHVLPYVDTAKFRWEWDLQTVISEESWVSIRRFNIMFSAYASIQENRYKLVQRWYLTPNRMAKLFRQGTRKCWCCKATHADYIHMWWSCPIIFHFWMNINSYLWEITKVILPMDPKIMLPVRLLQWRCDDIKRADCSHAHSGYIVDSQTLERAWKDNYARMYCKGSIYVLDKQANCSYEIQSWTSQCIKNIWAWSTGEGKSLRSWVFSY